MSVIYVENDNNVWIEGLLDDYERTYVNDSTLTFTLTDSDSNPVSGATAVSMPVKPGSNGRYRGVLDGTVSLTADATYTLTITSSNYNDKWVRSVVARVRR